MRSAILILAVLVGIASASDPLSFNLGDPVPCVQGNTQYLFSLPFPENLIFPSLNVTVDCSGSATWSLDLYAAFDFTGNWGGVQGFQSLSASLDFGFTLAVSAGVQLNILVGLSDANTLIPAQLWADLGQAVQAAIVQIDQATGIPQNVVPLIVTGNFIGAEITIDASGSASAVSNNYIFAAYNSVVPGIQFNTGFQIAANASQTFKFTDGQTWIWLNASESVQLKGHKNNTSSHPWHSGLGLPLGVFLTFDTYANGAIVDVPLNASIKFNFTTADLEAAGLELANITADNLKFVFWNDATSQWTFPPVSAQTNIEALVVSQITSHFSDWAVTYSPNSARATGSSFVLLVLAVAFAYFSA